MGEESSLGYVSCLPFDAASLTRRLLCRGVVVDIGAAPRFGAAPWRSKMARPRDRGKRKADSPPDVPPPDDVAAQRQHRRAAAERRSKAREDARRVHTTKTRELSRHGSPILKRGRVIDDSTSEEAGEESEHSRSMSDRQQSWRLVLISI